MVVFVVVIIVVLLRCVINLLYIYGYGSGYVVLKVGSCRCCGGIKYA